MYKNAADVIFGGSMYWLVGYGLSYGTGKYETDFNGWGLWALDMDDRNSVSAGDRYVSFVFQVRTPACAIVQKSTIALQIT